MSTGKVDPTHLKVWSAQQVEWFRHNAALGAHLYRHVKTGGVYGIVCGALTEADKQDVVVYRHLETGAIWTRPTTEFFDGRFQQIL